MFLIANGSSNCKSLAPYSAFMWLQLTTWQAETPSSPCFWLATQPLQSHTSSASTRRQGSPWAVQTRHKIVTNAPHQCPTDLLMTMSNIPADDSEALQNSTNHLQPQLSSSEQLLPLFLTKNYVPLATLLYRHNPGIQDVWVLPCTSMYFDVS